MKFFPTLLMLASFGGVASAATVLQTATFSGTPTYNDFKTFNQFDPSLGTLVSIRITSGVTSNGGRYSIDNDSDVDGSGTVTLGANVIISSDDVRQAGSSVEAVTTTTLDVAADDGDGTVYSNMGPDSASYNGGEVSASQVRDVTSNVFSDYTGFGTAAQSFFCKIV